MGIFGQHTPGDTERNRPVGQRNHRPRKRPALGSAERQEPGGGPLLHLGRQAPQLVTPIDVATWQAGLASQGLDHSWASGTLAILILAAYAGERKGKDTSPTWHALAVNSHLPAKSVHNALHNRQAKPMPFAI